ncbi:unnamed protein product [Paramecium octaurelia]|uniref:Tetratricopeptide repeat protein n=1 Tax=Paramecium octaurelia TaxID=43137 RepID=A0A8S1YMD7_PAROT|nr:unnamed protein product [Paramecium octaurelia]
MTQQLQNKEYLALKSQILIIKELYSKEKENCKQQQIIQFNNILDTLKKMLADQIKVEEQIDFGRQMDTKIDQQSGDQENQLNFEEAERLLNEGLALRQLNKYEEAIECYDKAISINPKYDLAWYNKGLALFYLNKKEEAIECYDKAISINPKYDSAWSNKGNSLFNLNKNEEANECCHQAISINPNNDAAWNNKVKTIYIKNLLQFQLFKQSFLLLIFQSSPFQCFYPSITGFLIFVNKLKEFKYGLTTKLPIL